MRTAFYAEAVEMAPKMKKAGEQSPAAEAQFSTKITVH